MPSNQHSYIDLFVGSSLSSLILASLHKSENPNNDVVILDSLSKIGGGNGSYLARNGELFDYGMRVYYECNIPKLDSIVTQSLHHEDLVFLEDNKKDPAACFFNGKIQLNSPCLDLRDLPTQEKELVMQQIIEAKRNIDKKSYSNCSEYLVDRLGEAAARNYFFPILEHYYLRETEALTVDASTAHFGLNERIILFDEVETLELMKDPHFRSRIAFPNQECLPAPYSKRVSRGIYPAQIGMHHILDGLKDNFLRLGGRFIFNADIEDLVHNAGIVDRLTFRDRNSDKKSTLLIQRLFWGAPIRLLANLLGYQGEYSLERGKKAQLAHVVFNKPINIGDLYYLFNFDPTYDVFRIVNYSAYCPRSSQDGGFRATIEYWTNSDCVNFEKIKTELLEMNIINESHQVIFQELSPTGPAFPLQSVKNEQYLEQVRDYVCSKALKNVVTFGQSSKKHTFYTPDILTSAYADYNELMT